MGRIRYGDEFDWDEDNEDKIAQKHDVDRYEAEDAARDPCAIVRREGEDRFGNPRYIYIGKTEASVFGASERRWTLGCRREKPTGG